MKENGINKLIELFKQHKRETGTSYEYILFRDKDAGLQARCIDDGKEIYIVRQAEILSKKMGFIKWLVDNDKIDRHSNNLELDMKRMRIPQDYYISGGQSLDLQHKKAQYLSLIALLSIQDNPIEFLISVLK